MGSCKPVCPWSVKYRLPLESKTRLFTPLKRSLLRRSKNGRLCFAVPLAGIKTTGVVRCDQPRVIDLNARHGRKVDTLPAPLMDEVLAKLVTLVE